MAIDLKQFIDGYKIHDVVLGDKKWVFREPTIKQLLEIKDQDGAEKLVKAILVEGEYEELEIHLKDITLEQRERFFTELLKELGLK